jgi:RNA polymerase sigma factor (sigma-70 family)
MTQNEIEMIAAYQRTGDKNILTLLVNRYVGLVKAIAYKVARSHFVIGMDCEDFIQLGFIGLIECIRRHDTQKYPVFSSYAWHYIYGTIMSGIRDFDRKPNCIDCRKSNVPVSAIPAMFDMEPYSECEKQFFVDTLRRLISKLPKKRWRDVIFMRYFDELSIRNIADHFSLSQGYVFALHNRALKWLRRSLQWKGYESA